MDEDHILFLLLGLSVISVAYCWWVWFRSTVKFLPTQARSWAEFVALIAVTLSLSLPFLALLPFMPRIGKGFYIAWALAALTLPLSFFSRGKLRVAELICGGMTCWFWWEVWQFAEAYSAYEGPQFCIVLEIVNVEESVPRSFQDAEAEQFYAIRRKSGWEFCSRVDHGRGPEVGADLFPHYVPWLPQTRTGCTCPSPIGKKPPDGFLCVCYYMGAFVGQCTILLRMCESAKTLAAMGFRIALYGRHCSIHLRNLVIRLVECRGVGVLGDLLCYRPDLCGFIQSVTD